MSDFGFLFAKRIPVKPPMKYLDAITGLRGFAALMVFAAHYTYFNIFSRDFGAFGIHAVLIFFPLSGFLLSNQFLSWNDHDFYVLNNYIVWFLARILRIFPLFLLQLFGNYYFIKL
jgi:peptidoglycan/LPS O-acetylase OafA/YrhL